MAKQKLLVITNCQGRKLVNGFLCRGSSQLADNLQLLNFPQAQSITPDHAARFREALAEADLILAQPLFGSELDGVRPMALAEAADAAGKQLITFPSLHFKALLYCSLPSHWRDHADYPFEATEDAAIAALFASGRTPSEAAQLFHEIPLATKDTLLAQVNADLSGMADREQRADLSVRMSDFYAQNWHKSRLHYVNAHPCGPVYVELASRLAPFFGAKDFNPDLVRHESGNDHFALPIKRWVHDLLGLLDEDDPDLALIGRRPISFLEMLEKFWVFYDQVGADEVARRWQSKEIFHKALALYRAQ